VVANFSAEELALENVLDDLAAWSGAELLLGNMEPADSVTAPLRAWEARILKRT
jgi:oligo-1,6-glucosidase